MTNSTTNLFVNDNINLTKIEKNDEEFNVPLDRELYIAWSEESTTQLINYPIQKFKPTYFDQSFVYLISCVKEKYIKIFKKIEIKYIID